jgi:glycosyltransferase involved in cell wall biosynthesis
MGILAELEREQPDVVHLFWGHYPCMVGYLVAETMPATVLSLFLGAHDISRRYAGSAWLAARADLVSTHARWNFSAIKALGVAEERIHLAYRGIDRTRFAGKRRAKVPRRILCAGRLEAGKGMDDVLVTFSEIRARWPDACLHVLGDGSDRAALESISRTLGIDRAVTFRGHVPQEEFAWELAAAEVFLFMSWEESERLPNVVKEAMASRCLCVVTDTYGIEELVRDGCHGFVVPRREVRAAVRRVDDIFSGRVDVAGILDAASDHIAADFDAMRSMGSYEKRWRDALALRRGGCSKDRAVAASSTLRATGLHEGT